MAEKKRQERNYEESVIVRSALPCTQAEKTEIKVILEKKLTKNIVLDYGIDKSLIAGLYIRIGDQVIDQTIRKNLEILRERLLP